VSREEKGGVTLAETVHTETYAVKGADFAHVSEAIFSRDFGKGFLGKGGRAASRTQLESSWSGRPKAGQGKWESVVIQATMTVTWPEWAAPDTASAETVKAWNEFLSELEEHDQGHVNIYHDALVSLGEALMNLSSADEAALKKESALLVKDALDRADKQQAGHDRRMKEKKKTNKK
jgi:predicted secreted Zn-dependent protease